MMVIQQPWRSYAAEGLSSRPRNDFAAFLGGGGQLMGGQLSRHIVLVRQTRQLPLSRLRQGEASARMQAEGVRRYEIC